MREDTDASDEYAAWKAQTDADNAEVERTLEVGARLRTGGSIATVEETDGELVTLRRAPGHWAFSDADRTVVAHWLSLRPVTNPLPMHLPFPLLPGEERSATVERSTPDEAPDRPTLKSWGVRSPPLPSKPRPKPAPMPPAESPFRRAVRLSRKASNA